MCFLAWQINPLIGAGISAFPMAVAWWLSAQDESLVHHDACHGCKHCRTIGQRYGGRRPAGVDVGNPLENIL
jgi:hypothetical protein